MSIENLDKLFAPQSVAVIGASEKPHSVGATVLHNLMDSAFKGAIFPVNPKYAQLAGAKAYARIAELPLVPDLAVICTPPASIPGIIAELGANGVRAAIVLTAGLGAIGDGQGHSLKQAMLDAAKPTQLRILGPNCVGLLVPGIGLNASFAHIGALPGRIAFVSQSGTLVTAVLDWATSRGIGFSKFISLGDGADVDFGDLLDYLAGDAETEAILMYVEDVHQARKFMSAARAAARSKPTILIKAGRAPEGAKAAASHTGALAGSDAVYDAAIRRAGMLRVFSTEDLFDAVETLAHAVRPGGERLMVVTNGGGPGVMATDALIAAGGKLATLSDGTLRKLNEILPATWSHGNPVDLIGDAPVGRYVDAIRILLRDQQADAILFIHAPTAIVPSADIATALAPVAQAARSNFLSCWLGGDSVARARYIFSETGLPVYDTPEDAVQGFMQIVQYRRNQNLLMQVPPSVPEAFQRDREQTRRMAQDALAAGRSMLSEPEAKALLSLYGIPVAQTRIAATVGEAVRVAQEIGFPSALKILSPDITHKSDVGGVVLDLETPEAVRVAAEAMFKRLQQLRPDAVLFGFSVQEMVRRPDAQELIVGVTTDPVFGPVVLFGQGGTAVEVNADSTIGLPPLNLALARDMVAHTRIAKLLAGYRNRPAADIDAICGVLIRISQLIVDVPEIAELDINPLLADHQGVVALDARIKLTASKADGLDRLAIRPYPVELEEIVQWAGETLTLRPIKPEDGVAHLDFFHALKPEDVRYRWFVGMREMQPSQLARLTQIDYDREMAFIATRQRADGVVETLGVARAITDPDNEQAEFAVIVRSDLKGHRLGTLLMNKLIAYCRSRHTHVMVGEALPDNAGIVRLTTALGFEVLRSDGEVQLRLNLNG